jgi:hypothetical protein
VERKVKNGFVVAMDKLADSDDLTPFTDEEKSLRESDVWYTLGGDSVPPKYHFHGTPKYVWDDAEDWQFGFVTSLSNEKYPQPNRGRSVYLSNSLAHTLYYGAFAFGAPFCSIEAIVIAVEINVKKTVNIRRKAGFAVLEECG